MTEQKEQGFQLDIMGMLHVLWRNILVILLVAVIGGAIAFGYTFFFVKPQYTATATLYVNRSSFSLGGANFSVTSGLSTDTLVDLYRLIINSRTTLEEVADEAGLNLSSGALRGMIRTADTGSGSFNITVTSSDPARAELIANTVAKILPDRIANIIDGSSVRVIDYAIIPSTRSSPDYIKSTVKGILIGVAVSAAFLLLLAFLMQTTDSAVHTSDDLKQLYPELAILATIPDMRVNGKNGYYYSSYYGSDKKDEKGKEEGK